MTKSSPSALPRLVSVLLLIALAGAGAYIVHLRAQLADLRTQLATASPRSEQPGQEAGDAGAAAAPADVPAVAAPAAAVDFMTAEQREAMLRVLKAEPDSGRKVWFHVHQNNADAAGAQTTLARVFEEAGWPVETVRSPYPLKAGVFLLAAEPEPPNFVNTVSDAFSAAGLDLKFLTGYREYFAEKKKENPNWSGPELASDQVFVLVIGSKPAPKSAEN